MGENLTVWLLTLRNLTAESVFLWVSSLETYTHKPHCESPTSAWGKYTQEQYLEKKYIIISKFVSKTYENCQARVGMFGLMSLPFQSLVDFPSSDDVLVLPLMFSDHKRQLLLWQLRKSSSLHQFLKLILGRLNIYIYISTYIHIYISTNLHLYTFSFIHIYLYT